MKVVLFHPVRLPPKDYGGVERVVLWLAKGLKELGHEVWVAARAGSLLPDGIGLIPMDPERSAGMDLLPKLPPGIDVVHFMAPPEKEIWKALPCAGILTVHGNGKPGEVFAENTVFLSRDHARRHHADKFVHNGIDPEEYRFLPNERKAPHFLFFSKTSWKVKNVQGAIELCARAGVPLQVAGGNRPLSARLRVALSSQMGWIGPVSGKRKAEELARAKGLLFPVLWDEPFGLVVVEALMSGTPVLAPRRGSLPELLTSEVGELLLPDLDAHEAAEAWVEALRKGTSRWSAEACRLHAVKHFHYLKMSESYERLYKRVVTGEILNPVAPYAPA